MNSPRCKQEQVEHLVEHLYCPVKLGSQSLSGLCLCAQEGFQALLVRDCFASMVLSQNPGSHLGDGENAHIPEPDIRQQGLDFSLSTLFKTKWTRIILDEAHRIKNTHGGTSQAAVNLRASVLSRSGSGGHQALHPCGAKYINT